LTGDSVNVLTDFIEQVSTAKWYSEHRFSKRKEEGEDVEKLLTTKIPGDGQTPLEIAIHAVNTLYKFTLGQREPELDLKEVQVPVDTSLSPTEQISQMYQLAIDELTELGEKHESLDDEIIHSYTKKEVSLRSAVRFFAFHLIEHSGQVIRFQHHLHSCPTLQEQ